MRFPASNVNKVCPTQKPEFASTRNLSQDMEVEPTETVVSQDGNNDIGDRNGRQNESIFSVSVSCEGEEPGKKTKESGFSSRERTWRLDSTDSSSSTPQSLLLKMSSFYKNKSRTFSWAIILLTISLVVLWICSISFLLSSGDNKLLHSGWDCNQPLVGNSDNLNPNLRPIIGVLAQEYGYYSDKPGPKKSYIAASYVKYLEGAGARVVPININGTERYVRKVFNSVNGILFPGGAVPLDVSKFGEVGRLLYQLAVEANENGDYFPVWGTCLGFEFMLYTAAGNQELRANCGANNVKDRLKFTDAASSSRLFGSARRSVINTLATKEVTVNFHHFCITAENFTKYNVDEKYQILSVNYDRQSGLQYISAVEAKKYPFYAVQFHPEKNIYEWTVKENIPHSIEAMESAQYFANFFVNEARKNYHKFETVEEENDYLIYNYAPTFSGDNGSTFEQIYLFPM